MGGGGGGGGDLTIFTNYLMFFLRVKPASCLYIDLKNIDFSNEKISCT